MKWIIVIIEIIHSNNNRFMLSLLFVNEPQTQNRLYLADSETSTILLYRGTEVQKKQPITAFLI